MSKHSKVLQSLAGIQGKMKTSKFNHEEYRAMFHAATSEIDFIDLAAHVDALEQENSTLRNIAARNEGE